MHCSALKLYLAVNLTTSLVSLYGLCIWSAECIKTQFCCTFKCMHQFSIYMHEFVYACTNLVYPCIDLVYPCINLVYPCIDLVYLSCQKWNGPKTAPHSTFSRKKWNGVPVLAAKNSTLLPKMELLFILATDRK